tara:strand:+ start:1327 stop:1896 length:570 start_codon:yes stop_codon:yes gene_type:complete
MKKFVNARRLINWPIIINGLTVSRILLGLPIIFALNTGNNDIFILLLLIGGLTDFFDGYLARKFNHKSVFGAKLDPLADKILLIAPMLWLVHEGLVPLWSIWLIISRELLITSWRSDLDSGGPASLHGKYKTTLQFISITLLLWPQNWGDIYTIYIINKIGYIFFWICLFLTYSSAIKYLVNQKATHQN